MLAEYKKKSNIGIAIAVAVWVLGGFLLVVFLGESLTEEDVAAIQGLGSIPFVYGLWCYAKGKGYHGAWGLLGIFCIFGLIILVLFPDKHKTVNKQNQEVKEPIQKGNRSMVIVKYTCPHCKTILEVERLTVERKVQCKKCKKMINLLPPPPEKKLSLKQKQKWCLWIGTGIMDLVGAAILHDRVVGRYGLKWSALDAFFLITLIIITTVVFFYTLSLTDEKPKDE